MNSVFCSQHTVETVVVNLWGVLFKLYSWANPWRHAFADNPCIEKVLNFLL